MDELHVERGEGDGPVWSGLIERLGEWWPGAWVAPDLPGHGRSPALPAYSFGAIAAEVARVVGAGRPVAVLGHSLGGVVGMTLASGWFGVPVAAVCGLGVKVSWTVAELGKAAELAAKPARVSDTREEVLGRARKLAGLPAVDGPADPCLVASTSGGWRPALDPAAFAVGRPDLPGLLAAARAPITLAAGENDPMSPGDHLRALVHDPVVLPGVGHSAHVEDPDALEPLVMWLRDHCPAIAMS